MAGDPGRRSLRIDEHTPDRGIRHEGDGDWNANLTKTIAVRIVFLIPQDRRETRSIRRMMRTPIHRLPKLRGMRSREGNSPRRPPGVGGGAAHLE